MQKALGISTGVISAVKNWHNKRAEMQKISIEMPKRSAKMTEISVKRPFRPQCVEKLAQYGGKNNTMKITTITVFRISAHVEKHSFS